MALILAPMSKYTTFKWGFPLPIPLGGEEVELKALSREINRRKTMIAIADIHSTHLYITPVFRRVQEDLKQLEASLRESVLAEYVKIFSVNRLFEHNWKKIVSKVDMDMEGDFVAHIIELFYKFIVQIEAIESISEQITERETFLSHMIDIYDSIVDIRGEPDSEIELNRTQIMMDCGNVQTTLKRLKNLQFNLVERIYIQFA